MKLIFLDIDGVLITRKSIVDGGPFNPDKDCIKELNRITNATDAKIIVTSCWRVGRTIRELHELLTDWGVTGEVIGKTDWLPSEIRGNEIFSWLNSARSLGIDAFVIIDDDRDMGVLINKLVQTAFTFGLTRNIADEAIQRLSQNDTQTVENYP